MFCVFFLISILCCNGFLSHQLRIAHCMFFQVLGLTRACELTRLPESPNEWLLFSDLNFSLMV